MKNQRLKEVKQRKGLLQQFKWIACKRTRVPCVPQKSEHTRSLEQTCKKKCNAIFSSVLTCRRGHGFKSRTGLKFFQVLFTTTRFSSVLSCEDLLISSCHVTFYCQVFKKKIQEFREACYALTGYKIDVIRDNQYRLQSMYAERSTDDLLFEVSSTATEYQQYSLVLQLIKLTVHLNVGNELKMFLRHERQKCYIISNFFAW